MVLRKTFRSGRLVLLLVACASWGVSVHAETRAVPTATDLRIAAERFDEGRDAFRAGAYEEAAEHFEAADARAPSASALGLAMRSRAETGQSSRAATLAELVLRRHPDDVELVERAKAIIKLAKPTSGWVAVDCEPDCDLVVDEKLIHGRASKRWTLHLDPGSHAVVANWSRDRVATARLSVIAGEANTLKFKPVEPAPTRPKSTVERDETQPLSDEMSTRQKGLSPTLFWVGVGATVAVGGAAIWSGIDTLSNPGPDAVRQGCVGLGDSCKLYRQGQLNELRTNILIGTTAVLAVATAATGIFLTDFSHASTTHKVDVSHIRIRPWVEARREPAATGPAGNSSLTTVIGAEGRF